MDKPKRKNDDFILLEDEQEVEIDSKLSRGIGFSADDLLENRNRYVSKAQHDRIQEENFGYSILLGAVIASILAVMVIPTLGDCRPSVLGCGIVLSFVLGMEAFKEWRLWDDLRQDEVRTIESTVTLEINPDRNWKFKVNAGELAFRVSKDAFLAFHNGESYRIYYLPNSKRVLSVEPLKAKRQTE